MSSAAVAADAAVGPIALVEPKVLRKPIDRLWHARGWSVHGAPPSVHLTLKALHTAGTSMPLNNKTARDTSEKWNNSPATGFRTKTVATNEGLMQTKVPTIACHPDIKLSKQTYQGRAYDVYTFKTPEGFTLGMIDARANKLGIIKLGGTTLDLAPLLYEAANANFVDRRELKPATVGDLQEMICKANGIKVFGRGDVRVVADKIKHAMVRPWSRCVVRAVGHHIKEFVSNNHDEAVDLFNKGVTEVMSKTSSELSLARGMRFRSKAQAIIEHARSQTARLSRYEAYNKLLREPQVVWSPEEKVPTHEQFVQLAMKENVYKGLVVHNDSLY